MNDKNEIVERPDGKAALQEARDALNDELAPLMVVGRGLSPEEERRLAALQRAIELVDEAIGLLQK